MHFVLFLHFIVGVDDHIDPKIFSKSLKLMTLPAREPRIVSDNFKHKHCPFKITDNDIFTQKARNGKRSELVSFILLFKPHKHEHDYANDLKYCTGKEDIFKIGQVGEQVDCGIYACKGRPNQKRKAYEL